MIRDLSYAIRTLWRTLRFTLIAVLTIALEIGGNTAIFSAIDQQVLRSLPVPHHEQLVKLTSADGDSSFPIPVFEYLRERANNFDGIFASDEGRFSISINGVSDFVWDRFVSGNYDSVMHVSPILGRGFISDDDKPGSSYVAAYIPARTAMEVDPIVALSYE